MPPDSRFVYANGINHHFLEWGDPSSPPLIMVHAIGMCAQVWNWAARGLSKDYRVMCLDLRGHGDTDKPGQDYTFETLGQDVAAVLQALGLEGVYGVGHSAGGMSLLIADSLAPGTIDRAVLVDTRVGVSPMMMLTEEERVERMQRTNHKRTIWESREAMHEAYRERRVFKTWTDEVFGDYIQGGTRPLDDGRIEIKCPNDVEALFYEARVALDPARVLTNMQGQYLLLVGNYKGAQTEGDEAIQHLFRQSRGFTLKGLERGSHFVPMEYPEMVQLEIRRFLDVPV